MYSVFPRCYTPGLQLCACRCQRKMLLVLFSFLPPLLLEVVVDDRLTSLPATATDVGLCYRRCRRRCRCRWCCRFFFSALRDRNARIRTRKTQTFVA